jgi:hypothetical protein
MPERVLCRGGAKSEYRNQTIGFLEQGTAGAEFSRSRTTYLGVYKIGARRGNQTL